MFLALPFGWYLSCTFRLIPEKWPEIVTLIIGMVDFNYQVRNCTLLLVPPGWPYFHSFTLKLNIMVMGAYMTIIAGSES